MKVSKRIIFIFLIIILSFTFVSCNDSEDEDVVLDYGSFTGQYYDITNGIATMYFSGYSDFCTMDISIASGDKEKIYFAMSLDWIGNQFKYTDCTCEIVTYSDTESETYETVYTGKKGYFTFEDGILYWDGCHDKSYKDIAFVSNGTLLDEDIKVNDIVGEYFEASCIQANMIVEKIDDESVKIDIYWLGKNLYETEHWAMTCTVSGNKLSYDDGINETICYDTDGNITEYKDSLNNLEGYFTVNCGQIQWVGTDDESCETLAFIRLDNGTTI